MASDIVREGVFAINKPCGQSSAHLVRKCQIAFNPSSFFKPVIEAETAKRFADPYARRRKNKAVQVKIGHGGTLDPLATGVLIMGVGSATKALPQFLHCQKTYETVVLFGASSDTYDRVGRVLAHKPYDHITKEKLESALEGFRGKQMQTPPLYSALKMDGKPLYEYARQGKPIPREIEAKEVEVFSMELLEYYEPGKHNHRWPVEQAEASERNLAEQVWRVKTMQETGRKLTPEEKEAEDQAVAAHETFKKKFEERQDQLIRDSPERRQRNGGKEPMMSGALGRLPEPQHSKAGANLVPEAPAEDTPRPWSGEGPPAAKIRITVSSGYYVRSFCHDLGAKLNSAALMAELCRTQQSDFAVGGINCLEPEELDKGEEVWGPKVADMLARWNGEPEGNWEKSLKEQDKKQATTATANNSNSNSNHNKNHNHNHNHPKHDKVQSANKGAAEGSKAMWDVTGSVTEDHLPKNAKSAESEREESSRPEKRKRSESPNGAGKSPKRTVKEHRSQSDSSEKTWNGIQD